MEDQPALTQPRPSGKQALLARLRDPTAIAVVLLVLAYAWHWYDTGVEVGALREEIARRLRDSDADSRDARLIARQAQDAVREAQTRLTQLEAKQVESQNQQVAL